MAPTKTSGQTQRKATGNGKAPALNITSVTPPPRKGKAGTVAFSREQMQALAEAIKKDWTGDGQTYPTRAKANLRVTRIKRALIHYGLYAEAKEVKSRTWGDDGEARLALIDAATLKASA